MTQEERWNFVQRTIEYLEGYAHWSDEDGKVHLGTLIHDFLKDSRIYYNDLLK